MKPANAPRVGIVLSGESCRNLALTTVKVLNDLQIDCDDETILESNDPWHIEHYATNAKSRNVAVIVVFVDADAELPKLIAQETIVPVFAVPLTLKMAKAIADTDGNAAIMQTGKAGALNAGLMAARILAIADPALRARMQKCSNP